MPYLKIQSNKELSQDQRADFIRRASALVADKLGKPESYVMVAIEPAMQMLFAGSDDATVYMELKSIGLSESQTAPVSAALCEVVEASLGIPSDRVYIEFADAPRKMWGWKGATF